MRGSGEMASWVVRVEVYVDGCVGALVERGGGNQKLEEGRG